MTKQADYLKENRLENIRLRNFELTTYDELYSPRKLAPATTRFNWEREEKKQEERFKTRIKLHMQIHVSSESGTSLCGMNLTYEAIYSNKFPLDTKLFNNLKRSLYIIHLWPYAREIIHSTSTKVGIKPLILPPIGELVRGSSS